MKKQLLFDFLHHLLVAWTITAAVYLATENGWMTYIDGVTLALTEWRLDSRGNGLPSSDNQIAGVGSHQSEADKRVIIEISAKDYENYFDATSPLNRESLGDSIRKLTELTPKAIAIDIDISPGKSWSSTADALDQAIDKAHERGITIFLITPIVEAEDKDRRAVQQEWLIKRCEEGVIFGFPEGESENGVVLRYRKDYPSLGMVVQSWKAQNKDNHPKGLPYNWICDELKDTKDISHLGHLRELAWIEAKRTGPVPIDLRLKDDVLEFNKLIKEPGSAQATINKSVVFLGGSYDAKDMFRTALGERAGVEIHAAISRTQSENVVHPIAYVIELGLGLVLGWLLHIIIRSYFHSRSIYDRSVLDGRIFGGQMACTFSLYLAPFGLSLGAFYFAMEQSGRLLASGTWLNPAPMIVGVVIDSLVAQTTQYGESDHDGGNTAKPLGIRIFMLHPGLLWKLPLIIYSCVHLWLHTQH